LNFLSEESDEYKQLVTALDQTRDLLHFVNEEVREQENWCKAIYIGQRLDLRPIEGSQIPVLMEHQVSFVLS
jgi:hypothetical protein